MGQPVTWGDRWGFWEQWPANRLMSDITWYSLSKKLPKRCSKLNLSSKILYLCSLETDKHVLNVRLHSEQHHKHVSDNQSLYVNVLSGVVTQVRGQLGSLGLEKEPNCFVLASFSCSSCLWPRRYRYSMCITSVFLMRAFSLNSSWIRGMKPGLSRPARRKFRYRARTCFWSLLCRDIGPTEPHRTTNTFNKQRLTSKQTRRKLHRHADTSCNVH